MTENGLPRNPYETPPDSFGSGADASPSIRWRIAPTLFFGVLGVVGICLGLSGLTLIVGVLAKSLVDESFRPVMIQRRAQVGAMFALYTLISTWGVAWTWGARAFWKRKWRMALKGVAIGAIAFAIIWLTQLLPRR